MTSQFGRESVHTFMKEGLVKWISQDKLYYNTLRYNPPFGIRLNWKLWSISLLFLVLAYTVGTSFRRNFSAAVMFRSRKSLQASTRSWVLSDNNGARKSLTGATMSAYLLFTRHAKFMVFVSCLYGFSSKSSTSATGSDAQENRSDLPSVEDEAKYLFLQGTVAERHGLLVDGQWPRVLIKLALFCVIHD